MPAYMAKKCNWPHYGGAKCHKSENTFRDGRVCHHEALQAAKLLQEEHGQPVIINDMASTGDVNGLQYQNIWAKSNLLMKRYNERHTISQPPPPLLPRCQFCSMDKQNECYGAALSQKKYKMSFKGNLKR